MAMGGDGKHEGRARNVRVLVGEFVSRIEQDEAEARGW